MPYIKDSQRQKILVADPNSDESVDFFININNINCAGDLNFAISVLIRTYIQFHGGNYQANNDVMGALIGALLENYRTVTGPMEDLKIKENGDL